MDLCFINPSKGWRPEIYELAKHLPKNYSMIILQPSNEAEAGKGFYLSENICVKYVPSIFAHLHNSTVTIPIFKKWVEVLFDLVRYDQCDLVHVCDYEYLTSIPPILVRLKCNDIPIVIANDALIGKSYFFGSPVMDLMSQVYTFSMGRWILRKYNKVILLYSTLAEEARALGLPKEKISVIPNGIDVEKMISYQNRLDVESLRRRYGINEDEEVILYVGRLVKVKRVDIVLKVVEKLLNEGLNVKALIVGSGPQRAKLEKSFHSMRHNVVFTGFISEEEKHACYSLANLFILSSLSEGLPTVLLEAASFGLPMVATNTNGVPDIITHGKTGFLANKWNYDQYVIFARRILTDEDLAKKMGEEARKHVERNFSWEIIAKKYESIYESLLNQC